MGRTVELNTHNLGELLAVRARVNAPSPHARFGMYSPRSMYLLTPIILTWNKRGRFRVRQESPARRLAIAAY